MKPCEKCFVEFEYVDYIHHRCYTVQEWKRFSTNPVKAETNDFQFFNHITQRMESYDYITTAEILLSKHIIYIRDHTNRKIIGGMAKVPFKERLKEGLKSFPSKITAKNFDKGMKIFDKGMTDFSKSMDQMTAGLGGDPKNNRKNVDKLWGKTKKKSSPSKKKNHMNILFGTPQKSSKKNMNIDKLIGTTKVKIWSDKTKKRKSSRRSSKSDEWDKHETNLTKLWGKK